MDRHFKLSLASIKVNETLGDGIFGDADDMYLCGIGINKNGERYNYNPQNMINPSSENFTINFDPARVIFDLEIPYKDNDFLFCFWLYEEDNSSLRTNWEDVVRTFNYEFDKKIQELRSFNYPRSEETFQAFAEILLQMHKQVLATADSSFPGLLRDGDDVFYPFLIRASHLGGNPPFIDTAHLKKEYNGVAEGHLVSRGFSNYVLTFNYNYSKIDNLISN